MNFLYFIKSGFIGLILLFVIQLAGFLRGLMIQSGFMDGSVEQSLMGTKLIVIPILFFAVSAIFFLLWLYKDLRLNKSK